MNCMFNQVTGITIFAETAILNVISDDTDLFNLTKIFRCFSLVKTKIECILILLFFSSHYHIIYTNHIITFELVLID